MKRTVLFARDTLINNGNGYYPADIRRIYNVPSQYDGSGQCIGILEFSNGYSLRDAHQFWKMHNVSAPNVQFVSVDGTRNDGGRSPDDEEASLDLQWAGAIAPKATIVVYEANAGGTYTTFCDALVNTLRYILNDTTHHPSVLSISYGDAEENFTPDAMNQIAGLISSLDAKGITVCIASGDQGAYGMHDPNGASVRHADAPATTPLAVAVGGTSLQPDGSESAWTYLSANNGGATGGGFSQRYPAPDYQASFRAQGRGIPDVSFNADPATGYQIIFQGQAAVVGGTSVSCPVFAGIVALANQARAEQGLPLITNLVKTLYEQADKLAFRDITVGNNTFNGVIGYDAVTGWDACTGWGSLDADGFVAALVALGTGAPTSPSPTPPGHPVPTPTQPAPGPTKSSLPPLPTSNGIYVRVSAVISSVEPDVKIHGVSHHHLLLSNIQVEQIHGASQSQIQSDAFVAIRYGDHNGLPGPIPNLVVGAPIELQGQYILKNQTYPSIGNPGDPVIHFTHHPDGFVIYEGHVYQ